MPETEVYDLNFGDAWSLVVNGQYDFLTRRIWGGYWYMKHIDGLTNPVIVAHLKDNGGEVPATPYQEDLLARDWCVGRFNNERE